MSTHKRYFVNNLPDYGGGDVIPDKGEIKRQTVALVQTIRHKWHRHRQNCDGGLYVGLVGAAYMFYRLSKMPEFAEERDRFLEQAMEYLEPALEEASYTKGHGKKVDVVAFLLGNAGVYAVAAVIFKALGNIKESEKYVSEFKHLAATITPVNWFSRGGDEFLVGRSGYLAGALWLHSELNQDVLGESAVSAILDAMVESGQQYAHHHRSRIPLMYQYYGTEYLGAAHGLAGILHMMLSFPLWLSSRPHAKELIRKSLDALLALQTPGGNFPCAMDEIDGQRPPEDELVHWCHGAPGIVLPTSRTRVWLNRFP